MGTFPARAAQTEPRGDGMVVALSRVSGLTSSSVLKAPFYFQVAPLDAMPQDYSWEWNDFRSIDGGMHSNPQGQILPTWSFSSLFTSDRTAQFIQIRNYDVIGMARTLKQIGDTLRPFQLQFGQPDLWGVWDVVTVATMRALHIEERAGEPDARYFTVTFTRYPDYDPAKLAPPPPKITNAAGALTTVGQDNPNVVATLDSARLPKNGDTFALIAKHYYGDPSKWFVIARASGLTTISANTNLVAAVGHRKPPPRIIVPRLTATTTATPTGGGGGSGVRGI